MFTSVKETTEKDCYFTRSPTCVRKCSNYTNKPSAFYLKTQSVIFPRPAAGIVVLREFSQRHSIAFLLRYSYCFTIVKRFIFRLYWKSPRERQLNGSETFLSNFQI